MQSGNFGSSEKVLRQNQIEALRSLSFLFLREIKSLEQTQATLEEEIENDEPICLLKELQRFEAEMIRCALIRAMGNQTKAAKLLGMKATTLNMKIKRYKIDLTELN
jgi:transcriptional regulator with GAF, ATPase, and Fis domain